MATEVRVPLSEGGPYLAWDPEGRTVRVGDRLIPPRLRVDYPGENGDPDVTLVIVVRDGVPICQGIQVIGKQDGRDIRQADLKRIDIDGIIEFACAAIAVSAVEIPEGPCQTDDLMNYLDDLAAAPSDPDFELRSRQAMQKARVGRPVKLSDERIRKAAEIYRAHINDRPTDAVRRAFGVAPRTAAKYVMEARERGFLPPTTPGKKSA